MSRLLRSAKLASALFGALLLAACVMDFGEKDIRQFAPLSDTAVDGQDTAVEPADGFFGGGGLFEGGIL